MTAAAATAPLPFSSASAAAELRNMHEDKDAGEIMDFMKFKCIKTF